MDQTHATPDKTRVRRKESAALCENADRADLLRVQREELVAMDEHRPAHLDSRQVEGLIQQAIRSCPCKASSSEEIIGRVMAELKP